MERNIIKILLLEDNKGDAVLVRENLSDSNVFLYQITHVERLEDAVARLKSDTFDIILTDLSLPDSKGMDTVLALKEEAPRISIVVLTGYDDENFGIEAVRKGAQDYLRKDFINEGVLTRIISYAIERKKLEKIREDFLSMVSHELRTPMTIIKESLSQISDGLFGEVNEKQGKLIDMSLRNISRLNKVIDNLLDISKIEAGKFTVILEDYDMVQLIKDVSQEFELKLKNSGLSLECTIPDTAIVLKMDHEKIHQVLMNLLGNAFKFTEAGKIGIALSDLGDRVECTVYDSGKGIAQEDIEHIFNKFQQVGQTKVAREKGTGLGLAITKGIVDLHDGSIEVKSELNAGSRFIFQLPKHSSDNQIQ